MKHWTKRRRISFIIHVAFVSVPFVLSTVSALLFWHAMFASWWLAVPMVAVIDVLALTGLVLHILRVPSPFVRLRHLLPFISIIPLGRELYLLLEHNGVVIAGVLTVAVTAILVAIAWQCFTTIERLFIDPIQAARERAREQFETFTQTLAQLEEMNKAADVFVADRLAYRGVVVSTPTEYATDEEVDAIVQRRLADSAQVWQALAKTDGTQQAQPRKRTGMSQQAIADKLGKPLRTLQYQVRKGDTDWSVLEHTAQNGHAKEE